MKRLFTYALMSFLFVAGSCSLQASSLTDYAKLAWNKGQEAAKWAQNNPKTAAVIAAVVVADPIAKHKYGHVHGVVGYAHEWVYYVVSNTLGLAVYKGAQLGKYVSETVLSMWEEPVKAAANVAQQGFNAASRR